MMRAGLPPFNCSSEPDHLGCTLQAVIHGPSRGTPSLRLSPPFALDPPLSKEPLVLLWVGPADLLKMSLWGHPLPY